jgi:cytoskeletal protein CcmA (bactofilin family)
MAIEASKTPKQTLVEEGTEFNGTLKSSCPLVVNGTIDGQVDAPEITITRSGAVLGIIKAKKLRSQGMISGNVDAGDVFLSGSVRSNTVIKAKSLEVKLGSERGQLEVTFGECNLEVGEPTDKEKDTGSNHVTPSADNWDALKEAPGSDTLASLEGTDTSLPSSRAQSSRNPWKQSRVVAEASAGGMDESKGTLR